MKSTLLLTIGVAMTLLAACGVQIESQPTPDDITAPSPTTEPAYPRPVKTLPPPDNLTAYPVASSPTMMATAPVKLTPAQEAALEAASKKYGIPVEKIILVRTAAVTWRDGCLEVYTPRRMCTEALVDGYRISMEAGGKQLEYRTNLDGTVVVDASSQP